MTLQQKGQPSLSSLVTSAFFQSMTLWRYSRFQKSLERRKDKTKKIF